MTIIYIALSFLFGAFICFLAIKPGVERQEKLNLEIIAQNNQLKVENQSLQNQNQSLRIEQAELVTSKNDLKNSIFILSQQAEESAEILYNKNLQVMQEKLDQNSITLSKKFQEASKQYEDEYLSTMQEYSSCFLTLITQKQEELKKLNQAINEQQAIVHAIVEENKREQKIKDQVNFYKLILTEEDKDEIKKLREVGKYLRNKEPLNKVIWKVYYEKPYTDLIGRVIGNKQKTGIYKITNAENKMCYVGQATDVAERWKQHIKRGLGAEEPTKNKLYPAMQSFGVENFTFELIEECEKIQLNDKEDYWQDFYKAKEFGYSIK